MRAIITNQPASEVTRIDSLAGKTVFHLADGQVLHVGVAPEKLQASLNRWDGVRGIDLSAPPATQPEIFYYPFMPRSVWEIAWPIVRTHPKIQKAFRGHPKLEAITQLSYEELRSLPLEAYVSHPFGLYLGHPVNFVSRAPDPTVPDNQNEYRCTFRDGDYLVSVFVNVRTRAVAVERDHSP
jgi:hypothetical protein